MTVTFTTIRLGLRLKHTDIETLKVIEDMANLGCSGDLEVDIQLHVTGENADALIEKYDELQKLGAISTYPRNHAVTTIRALKEHYLR